VTFPRAKIGRQGTWPQALALFFLPLFLIFAFRWFVYEPFVIPSESMVPNLLIHDHILVKKFSYGLKWPIGDGWLYKWREPTRGDVIVFRYPENRDVFYIKRLIGLPGDKITVQNGQISVNDKPWVIQNVMPGSYPDEDTFNYFIEEVQPERPDHKTHVVRFFSKEEHLGPEEKEFIVPAKSYFAMGDNRDQSHDSRFWGFIPEEFLVGRAHLIWLSCEETLESAPFICDPLRLRVNRFFQILE
jgi:signal peptidase I